MKKCFKESLDEIFAKLSEELKIYLPVDDEKGRAVYTEWSSGKKWSESLNTAKSPKELFFPQTENLMEFKVSGKSIELTDTRSEAEDFIVFGARACDVKALEVLDRVFLSEPQDSYYASRREHGIIISCACTRPSETCFCGTFGIDPASPAGDVSVWRTDAEIFWQANTEKGKALLEKAGALLEECDEGAADAQKEQTRKIMAKLPLASLKADAFGSGKTEQYFDSQKWDELSESCLGCGTCTFVCPTCQCYDIKDFNTGNGVIRFRCWDSCMYSEFTKMSAGQPRLTQKERFRQRFMHKLVYFPTNNDGMFGCVGCGRCLAKCPISMNIVKVMKALGGKGND